MSKFKRRHDCHCDHPPGVVPTSPAGVVPAPEDGPAKKPVVSGVVAKLGWGIVIGLVGVVVHGWLSGQITLVPLMWAAGSLACGAAVGFLFGIPRVHQGDRRPAGGGATPPPVGGEYALEVNANLVEISDWLCKIIVGLGLIELRRLPEHLDTLAATLGEGMGGGTTHRAFAGGLVVYFGVVGFLYGYLLTRLYLARMFSEADQAAISGRVNKIAAETADLSGRLELSEAMVSGVAAELPNAPTADVASAIERLEAARRLAPDHRGLAMVLSVLLSKKLDNRRQAVEVLTRTLGYMQARGTDQPKDVADLLLNRACINTLSAAADGTAEAERDTLLKAVRDDLTESVRLWPDNVNLIKNDPDLKFLRESKPVPDWFTRLTAQAR